MALVSPEQTSKLSARAQAVAKSERDHPIWAVLQDQWDPQSNSNRYVSIGVAENRLMHAEIEEYIKTKITTVPQSAFTYGDGPVGSNRLRDAVAHFLHRHMDPVVPLNRDHVTITNGVTHAIEHCSWAFADPGDGFLLGRPYYTAFIPDISLRPGVRVIKVRFGDTTDPMSLEAVPRYEASILEAKQQGVTISGLMLCNPHNPLGRCYSRKAILAYMKLCQKYQIHFVSDEIYALSVWETMEACSASPP